MVIAVTPTANDAILERCDVEVSLVVTNIKWREMEFQVEFDASSTTVQCIREYLQEITGVVPAKQKLIGLQKIGKVQSESCSDHTG